MTLPQPYKSSCEIEEAEEGGIEFIEAGEDSSEVFYFIEESLYGISFFVKVFVVVSLDFAVGFWGDDRLNSKLFQEFEKPVRIKGLVGQERLDVEVFQQRQGGAQIMGITRGQQKAQRIPQCIHNRIDFTAESTLASS